MPKLNNWGITSGEYGNLSPWITIEELEQYPDARIVGEVYGHSVYPDGKTMTSSAIRSIKDDVAETKSGSIYQLDEPHPQYKEINSLIDLKKIDYYIKDK